MGTQRKWMTITGWVITLLLTAGLVFSALSKFTHPPELLEGVKHFEFDLDTMTKIGYVEAGCLVLFLIPQTATLGAVLLTGYLGGAIATHVRVGDPPGQMAAPIIMGVLVWLALFFRDPQVRALLPIRCTNSCSAPKE
jgi:hypothetical protein